MDMEDITEIDSAYFVIDAAMPENVEGKKYIAYLLFVNTDKDNSIKVDYDLTVVPVPEFDYLHDFSFIIGNTLSDANIHVFNDGTNSFVDNFSLSMPGVFIQYADEYYSPVSYSYVQTDEIYEVHVTSDWVEQRITYNFMTGELIVYDKEIWSDPEGSKKIDVREVNIVLQNVFIEPIDLGSGKSGFRFSTNNTIETQESLQSISFTRELATWNVEEQTHNPTITTSYVSTNWDSSADITFYIWLY
jgi:hypothetical protein